LHENKIEDERIPNSLEFKNFCKEQIEIIKSKLTEEKQDTL